MQRQKVGRKWLPKLYENRFGPEDKWWAVYFAGFLLMLCCSILTFTISLEKWHFLLTLMMHNVGGVGSVCVKWHTTKLQSSPASTALPNVYLMKED